MLDFAVSIVLEIAALANRKLAAKHTLSLNKDLIQSTPFHVVILRDRQVPKDLACRTDPPHERTTRLASSESRS